MTAPPGKNPERKIDAAPREKIRGAAIQQSLISGGKDLRIRSVHGIAPQPKMRGRPRQIQGLILFF